MASLFGYEGSIAAQRAYDMMVLEEIEKENKRKEQEKKDREYLRDITDYRFSRL